VAASATAYLSFKYDAFEETSVELCYTRERERGVAFGQKGVVVRSW
jgi:hypothetical protein